MPLTSEDTGFGQDWARGVGGKGRALDRGVAVPGWVTQVSRLWMWGAPRDRPGPRVRKASTGVVRAKQRDALLRRTCPSSFHANPKGRGREPRNGFSGKNLKKM